jgi:hypothetical protein
VPYLKSICACSAAPEGNSSKGSKPGADAEEIDALLAELDAPKQPAAETTGSKKKKKKKVRLTCKCMPADPALDICEECPVWFVPPSRNDCPKWPASMVEQGGAADKPADEDLDAILAELGGGAPSAAAAPADPMAAPAPAADGALEARLDARMDELQQMQSRSTASSGQCHL